MTDIVHGQTGPHDLQAKGEVSDEVSDEEKRASLLKFASSTVHEVAGPIDQIASLAALFVRRYRGQLDADAEVLLSHIESAGARVARAGTGLRKYFLVSTAECVQEALDMNTVLNSALTSLGKQIAECEAEVHVDPLPTLRGDPGLFTLLFSSLLENSLKFRRPDVRLRIAVSCTTEMDRHVFQVRDNGIGMDAARCQVVFEPFKRLNGHSYPGTGLGLTIAQAIVDLHRGAIRIEPDTEGIRVFVELPASS